MTEDVKTKQVLTEDEIIKKAAKLFDREDKLKAQKRELDMEISILCRAYGDVMKVWGWAPHHLRDAVNRRMKKCA